MTEDNQQKKRLRAIVALLLLVGFLGLVIFEPHKVLTLEQLKDSQAELSVLVKKNPFQSALIYFGVYVTSTALSVPGATVLTLAGSALFGFFPALLLVSFASTIGATLAFLLARFLLKDWIQARYLVKLQKINKGFDEEGAFYLFALRLVPAFPFFVINVVMGLTPIGVWTYYWVSQVGMLPGTAAYVYAGMQLGSLESVSDVFSLRMISAFAVLGLMPLLSKRLLASLSHSKNLK